MEEYLKKSVRNGVFMGVVLAILYFIFGLVSGVGALGSLLVAALMFQGVQGIVMQWCLIYYYCRKS